METIDLGITSLDEQPLHIDLNTHNISDGNIPGIELLMNENVKKGPSNIDVGDLNNLEDELNNLAQVDIKLETKPTIIKDSNEPSYLSGFSNILGGGMEEINTTNIGSATKEDIGNTNTWDGFTKINDIPDTKNNNVRTTMTEREMRRKKRAMIKKMEEWSSKGLLSNYSNYNMDSAFDEVEDEYETALEDKRKKDSVKLQGWWFTTLINSLEYANSAFDPFGVNLDGWGETLNEDLDSYDEIFGELHEKYKGGKMAPELNLLLRIGFSAAVTNFTNKALSSSVPGFNDVIRQSPELMKAFTSATVNSMSQQSPGFSFANQMMQDESLKKTGPPPPGPIKTRDQQAPMRAGQMAFTDNPVRRPDINVARGNPNNGPMPAGAQEYASTIETKRPEMKGPSNIDSILSGLKQKNINIQQEKTENSGSVISVSSLNELTSEEKLPKGTKKRKQKSDKNTISLDI